MIAISVLSAFTRSVNKGAPTSTNQIAKRFAIEHFQTRFLEHNFQNREIGKDREIFKRNILSKELQSSSDWWISWTPVTSITDRSRSTGEPIYRLHRRGNRSTARVPLRSDSSAASYQITKRLRFRSHSYTQGIDTKRILLVTDWRMERSPRMVEFRRDRS